MVIFFFFFENDLSWKTSLKSGSLECLDWISGWKKNVSDFRLFFYFFWTCPSKKLKQSPSFDSFRWLFISFSSFLFSFDTVSSSSTRCCAFIVLNDQRVETESESELIKANRVRIWRMYYVFGCRENKGKWHRIMYYLQLLTLFFFFLNLLSWRKKFDFIFGNILFPFPSHLFICAQIRFYFIRFIYLFIFLKIHRKIIAQIRF